MSYRVASLYRFVPLPDCRDLREPLRRLCADLGLRGTLLLAPEGINGTVAGTFEAIDDLLAALATAPWLGGRLGDLDLRFSSATAMPFRRLKVRLKREIVTLGDPCIDPTRRVGTYVAAEDWNALLDAPDVVTIDTRNGFEVAMGTFEGALDPNLKRFSGFRDFADRTLDPVRHRKVAMFCTGGIRCEKASAFLLSRGFEQVFHLKGGILTYLDRIPPAESRWTGTCFVFDDRVALGHGLTEPAIADGAPDLDDSHG